MMCEIAASLGLFSITERPNWAEQTHMALIAWHVLVAYVPQRESEPVNVGARTLNKGK